MDISTMTVIELKKIAKKNGISGVSKLKKEELIKIIKEKVKFHENEKISKMNKKDYNLVLSPKLIDNTSLEKSDKILYLKQKVNDSNWGIFKKEIEEIITDLEKVFFSELNKEKKDFISSGGKEIDFYFKSKEKEEFNKITYEYRKIKRFYFKEIESQKKTNSTFKKTIIEQLKELIGSDESINVIYKKFKILQESWHKTGPATRTDSEGLWETYKHHVERFYDFLHINRELRNLDYKHNYTEKIKIIERAESIVKSNDIIKAGRDLNILHRLWKNELGPVAPEERETLWKRFQDASKIIHSKRQDFQKNIEQNLSLNFEKKKIIIDKIKKLTEPIPENHKEWQLSISKFNDLRKEFISIGSIPKSKSKENWEMFREGGRAYNLHKNQFYKKQKNNQKETIENYRKLLKEVKTINEKEDWKNFTIRMKSIQTDFNKLGFVPRNILKKFRSEFQKETNLYFKRLKSDYQKLNSDIEIIYNKKIEIINGLEKNIPTDNTNINEFYKEQWGNIENIGVVNNELETKVVNLFIKDVTKLIKVNSNLAENNSMIIFEIELNCIKTDLNKIQIKIDYYKKMINDLQAESTQLENNLEFFSKSSTESPLLKEVTKKLNFLTTKLFTSKEKINKLKSVRNNIMKSSKKDSEMKNIVFNKDE